MPKYQMMECLCFYKMRKLLFISCYKIGTTPTDYSQSMISKGLSKMSYILWHILLKIIVFIEIYAQRISITLMGCLNCYLISSYNKDSIKEPGTIIMDFIIKIGDNNKACFLIYLHNWLLL